MAARTHRDVQSPKRQDVPKSVRRTKSSGAYASERLSFDDQWEGCTVKKAMTANRTWEIRPYGMIGRPGETWIVRLRALQIYPDRFRNQNEMKTCAIEAI